MATSDRVNLKNRKFKRGTFDIRLKPHGTFKPKNSSITVGFQQLCIRSSDGGLFDSKRGAEESIKRFKNSSQAQQVQQVQQVQPEPQESKEEAPKRFFGMFGGGNDSDSSDLESISEFDFYSETSQ